MTIGDGMIFFVGGETIDVDNAVFGDETFVVDKADFGVENNVSCCFSGSFCSIFLLKVSKNVFWSISLFIYCDIYS